MLNAPRNLVFILSKARRRSCEGVAVLKSCHVTPAAQGPTSDAGSL
ncbi:hypothetical protein EM6_1341 [Asticcacaulis excentricus]|uniref:Uncharacterized protein n=1 Tax=Asticcacaulis excentricus TaxID=78587 RepID=A0A3G9G294_9CAUL|nr:hypothetical protein EM6_1341 [Asticcacaulis excentricus]